MLNWDHVFATRSSRMRASEIRELLKLLDEPGIISFAGGLPAPDRLHLELLGADRPGIVAEISAALAQAQVSIEELSTDVRDAPMAGGTLFEARAVLRAPAGSDTDALRAVLEDLADELMVEIRLSDD